MTAGSYPFIDIAVHDEIRTRFSRGEALVLFTADMGKVLWADGEGARLLGFATPYELMDDWSTALKPMHRQLQAAASLTRRSGAPQTATLRLTGGMKSRLVSVGLLALHLSDGRPAVLLTEEAGADGLDLAARAGRIVAGLGDAETHVAVLDERGAQLAASAGFPGLDHDPALAEDLIAQTAVGRNRLTKRMIAAGAKRLPAAMARLSDDPALYLLFVLETDDGPAASEEEQDAALRAPGANGNRRPAAPVTLNAWSLDPKTMAGKEPAPSAAAGSNDNERAAASEAEAGSEALPEQQDFVFPADGRSVRFAWKIDAAGRFKELSPEFAAAVGPNAADIIGRRFEDVARVFGFDRDNRISDLLKRRDTWSGRSVSWPVQGTDLSVPVELAALPTYTADREFDGFKGFGIARTGEAEKDPEALGLSLATKAPAGRPDEAATPDRMEATTGQHADEPPETMPDADASDAGQDELAAPGAPADTRSEGHEEDPFRGEKPALKTVKPFGRRQSDKVIDLSEHRPRTREVLSSMEQQAFREIGERLAKSFGSNEGVDERPDGGAAAEAQAAPGPSNANETNMPAAGESPGELLSSEARHDEPKVASQSEREASARDVRPIEEESERPAGEDHLSRPSSEGAANGAAIPSAFAAPGRIHHEPAGLSEEIVDDLPLAVLFHNGETLHHANPEFFALTGYADLDALKQAGGLGALFDAPEDGGDMVGEGTAGTLRLMRADGAELPVLARLKSVLWHDERALMLSLVPAGLAQAGENEPAAAADVEERDDEQSALTGEIKPPASRVDPATAALKIEVEELRSILETATDGVVILGDNGEIRSMNRSASALFDYDEADTRGQPFAKLFAHESQRAVMDYLNGLREHGVASVLNDGREVIGREASGGFLPLFMTIGRLTGSNGYCAVMRDITQWKRTEEELRTAKFAAERASAHKSEFLARVSHEIRTPLNAIIGFSEMMAEQRFGPIGSPRYLEYAHDIGQSGKHVLDIVNDLLDISKIEAGEMEVSFSAVALNETIAEAVSLMQPQANSQRVIIRTSLSSSVPEIVADQRSIKQIALNLLSNAIRFTPAGGQIVVSTAYEESGSVVLRIRDTGVGMSRGELEQAMKPFRQVQGTASRPRGDGTGLGLPLTKAMVEANRAEFEIRSAPSEGTLIEITFPSQRVLAD